ncbi:MAG: O-antigen ligase family protein [Parvibaculales bacterium]
MPETRFDDLKTNMPWTGNLSALIHATLALLLVALPFKNVFYHFALFVLLFCLCVTLARPFRPVLRDQLKSLAPLLLGCMAVSIIMMVSNALNGRNGDAWSIAVNFSLRYGLLIFALTYFHRLGLLSARRIMIFALLALLIQAGISVLQYSNILASLYQGWRITGAVENPNPFGFYMAIGVGLALYGLLRAIRAGQKIWAGLWFGLAALFLFCCLQAGSRGAWLSLLAFGLVYAACEIGFTKQWKSLLPLLGLGGVALGLFCLEPHLRDRLDSLLAMQSSYRLETWEIIIARFVERPFFGHGMHTQSYFESVQGIYGAHNIVLDILLTLGLFGLLAYGFLAFLVGAKLWRGRRPIMLAMTALLLVNGMFGYGMTTGIHYLTCWVLLVVFAFILPAPVTEEAGAQAG